MATDIERLLAAVSAESPCGEDLSYDPAYAALEREIVGTPEQQVGDQILPAQDPDWRQIKEKCLELFGRSKDLRIALHLTLALMQLEGLVGLRDGLGVVLGLIDRHWDSFWPKLDPTDNNDPTERMNIISALAPESSFQDPVRFPQRLLEVPLASSAQMGRVTLRAILIAKGEITPSGQEPTMDAAQIDATFATAKDDEVSANAAAIVAVQETLAKIEASLAAKVGAARVPNLAKFTSRVKEIRELLDQKTGGGGAAADAAGGDQSAGAAPGAARGPGISGGISTRADVVKALDLITSYYRKTEPASPVPLLMQRARRLVEMSFMEIIKDMSPESMEQLSTILGIKEEEKSAAE